MPLLSRLFAFLAPYDCMVCGRQGQLLCDGCLPLATVPPARFKPPPPLGQVWIGSDYAGPARQLLHLYKYERARDAVEALVLIIDRALPALPMNTIVTYVPTASSRIRKRGYDQAQELAIALAKHRGLKVKTLLMRHGQQRQVGATRAQRQAQAGKTYVVKPGLNLKGTRVLIIDDVITTGSTMRAATRVLVKAGAKSVDAAVVTYKP